jgi:DNA polymerase III epsilon subunit-like protein
METKTKKFLEVGIMRTIIVDMETTGLHPEEDDVWNIAWIIAEENRIVKMRNHFYPLRTLGNDYWNFKESFEKIDGLIYPSKYKVTRNHHWTEDVELMEDFKKIDVIVAHNIAFELSFIEPLVPEIREKAQYCTMRLTTNICKIPHDYYVYKYPKLQEAYSLLIKDKGLSGLERFIPGGWHNAIFDIFATMRLYEVLTNTQFNVSMLTWLQAGVVRGYLGELKGKMKSKLWELKNIFKKEEEELPF